MYLKIYIILTYIEIYKHIDLTCTFSKNPSLKPKKKKKKKKRISKGGLYEPPRLENQAGGYCFQFQCLFSATAASQTTLFPKKSFERNFKK